MFLPLVAGLGNPGRDYAQTRHNLGWVVLNALAQKHGLSWKRAAQFEGELARWDLGAGQTRWLFKPLTFMNDSGRAIAIYVNCQRPEGYVSGTSSRYQCGDGSRGTRAVVRSM